MGILKYCASACFGLILAAGLASSARALDPGFQRWVQELLPDAQTRYELASAIKELQATLKELRKF